MNNSILTVTLNPAIDKTVEVRNFKTGRDFREEDIELSAGGKGINVSRALKNLGAKSICTGFLGGAAGAYLKQELKKEDILCDFLDIGGQTRTNLTIIDSRSKAITRIIERGPRITPFELKRFKTKFRALLKNCSYVIFSGSMAPGLADSLYAKLIGIAAGQGVKCILDAHGRALLYGLKARPFAVKLNRQEAEYVVGKTKVPLAGMPAVLFDIHRTGAEITIITMGSDGAIATDGNEVIKIASPRISCVNNVGCGDTFLAGFISSYRRAGDFRHALVTAAAAAAASALTVQPGYFRKVDFVRIRQKVKVQQVVRDLRTCMTTANPYNSLATSP